MVDDFFDFYQTELTVKETNWNVDYALSLVVPPEEDKHAQTLVGHKINLNSNCAKTDTSWALVLYRDTLILTEKRAYYFIPQTPCCRQNRSNLQDGEYHKLGIWASLYRNIYHENSLPKPSHNGMIVQTCLNQTFKTVRFSNDPDNDYSLHILSNPKYLKNDTLLKDIPWKTPFNINYQYLAI